MALYAIATAVVLYPTRSKSLTLPVWIGVHSPRASPIILPLIVASQLDPHRHGGNGYATWYVAAVGTLMVIVSTRRRHGFAWVGVGFLVVHSSSGRRLRRARPASAWSAASAGSPSRTPSQATLARASRDTREFIRAEQEAADWQAAQEAHVNERQFRLLPDQPHGARRCCSASSRRGGDLSPAERAGVPQPRGGDPRRDPRPHACSATTSATRSWLRGAAAPSSACSTRAASTTSTTPTSTASTRELAEAIRDSAADRLIIRTVADGGEYAVTVVGLSSEDLESSALGSSTPADDGFDDDEDDDDGRSARGQPPGSARARDVADGSVAHGAACDA